MVKRAVLAIATAACFCGWATCPAPGHSVVALQGGIVMRRRIGLLFSLVTLLALGGGTLAATPAWATPPQHFHQQINLSIRDDELSAACGFDVVVVFAGNVNTTLFYDQSGALVRSSNSGPGFTQSFTAPSTGKSIVSRSPFPLHADYTGGGAVGTPAVFRATGLVFMFQPGVMFTGRQVFEAVVIGHTPEGIPILGDANLISQSGNFFSGDLVPVICAALSGP
ncbi:MAG TPA: hypothetical protein VE979_03395 [Streptosporangiaceae bacterium]|jgi:hypothetical protein|nr:hypothetical protein [Streptosporangiaceae bacterium]